MLTAFSDQLRALPHESVLLFYARLAHGLTVIIRRVLSDERLVDVAKQRTVMLVNEAMHRITSKLAAEAAGDTSWDHDALHAELAQRSTQEPSLTVEFDSAIRSALTAASQHRR